jgi:hypothetical protein
MGRCLVRREQPPLGKVTRESQGQTPSYFPYFHFTFRMPCVSDDIFLGGL